MRTHRHRPAALLLTGALVAGLFACAPASKPSLDLQVSDGVGAHAAATPPVPAEVFVRAPAEEQPAVKGVPKKEEAGEGFHFPDDKGGQMLARVLPPADRLPQVDPGMTLAPKRLPGSPALEQPSVPLPSNQGQVPRLPAGRKGPPLRPRPLSDDLPVSGARPEPPQELQFPAGDRVRLPGPDVNQPTPLPVLATPAADRTSADDPTADYSSAAAQSAGMPPRNGPAPFAIVSLPDPFENRNAVRLREAPPEKADPVTSAPKPPGK